MIAEKKILLVEDDPSLGFVIKDNLTMRGYTVTLCTDGEAGERSFRAGDFNLCIFDVMLPKKDGFALARSVRESDKEIPILFLTAKSMTVDKLTGFQTGADDYITKPFNLEELLLRVQKLIDKNKKMQEKDSVGDTYEFGGHTIDFNAQEALTKDGQRIALSKKEAMLLKLLIENKNDVVPREKILQTVWGYNVYPTTRTIDNFILNFRKYFEEDSRNPRYFHSVRGVGYKYTE